MDPNAALKALRDAVDALEGTIPHFDPLWEHEDKQDVVNNFRALDEWLSEGGSKSMDWA